jgi:hypothetical protein
MSLLQLIDRLVMRLRESPARLFAAAFVMTIALGPVWQVALAQTPPAPPPPAPTFDWHVLLAGFINAVVVVGVVQLIKSLAPTVRTAVPWLLPILSVAIGPLVATLQSWVGTWVGLPIDLSPLIGAFTGGTAVMMHQTFRQARTQPNARR